MCAILDINFDPGIFSPFNIVLMAVAAIMLAVGLLSAKIAAPIAARTGKSADITGLFVKLGALIVMVVCVLIILI